MGLVPAMRCPPNAEPGAWLCQQLLPAAGVKLMAALAPPTALAPIAAETALALVAEAFGVPVALLSAVSPKRRRPGGGALIRARQAAAWLLRARGKPGTGTRRSFDEIGRLLGIYHSSVIHACRRAEHLAAREAGFAAVLAELAGDLPSALGTFYPAPRLSASAARALERAGHKAAVDAALAASAGNARERNRLCHDDPDAAMRARGTLALGEALRRAQAGRLEAAG